MGAAYAFSAWLGLEALQGGPSIGGRVLDAQTGDPVAGAAIVIDGRTAGAAGADGVFSVPAGSTRRLRRARHRGRVHVRHPPRRRDRRRRGISATSASTASPPASPNSSTASRRSADQNHQIE